MLIYQDCGRKIYVSFLEGLIRTVNTKCAAELIMYTNVVRRWPTNASGLRHP